MSAQHVLIVEDSLVYRRLLSRMLTQWGYIVSEAENGVAALAILENQPVSLVISDWEMPEMNGLMLCREVRRRQFGHYVYLILLTAREDPGDLTQGFAAGPMIFSVSRWSRVNCGRDCTPGADPLPRG
ncbi:chemotaxis regulator [Klebsiella pneumoniae]|uniref:Chemotaxis regulator n=1 Tax=Klebsiella pneumoniae TaxID=573 RepID=A0A377TU12_KLEPN|nr:chemotaxis regulator [Klebsiella pneumoniae]